MDKNINNKIGMERIFCEKTYLSNEFKDVFYVPKKFTHMVYINWLNLNLRLEFH